MKWSWRHTRKERAATTCHTSNPLVAKLYDFIDKISAKAIMLKDGTSAIPGTKSIDEGLISAIGSCEKMLEITDKSVVSSYFTYPQT